MKTETFNARVISHGRITIDEKVRVLMDIQQHDMLRVTIEKLEVPHEQEQR